MKNNDHLWLAGDGRRKMEESCVLWKMWIRDEVVQLSKE